LERKKVTNIKYLRFWVEKSKKDSEEVLKEEISGWTKQITNQLSFGFNSSINPSRSVPYKVDKRICWQLLN